MSDFEPRYFPADKLSVTTSAPVTAGQVLVVSGNNTVAPSSAAAIPFGIAAYDDAAGGNQIMAYRCGVHILTSTGTINAGDAVIPAASGAVQTIGSETNYNRVVGIALAAAASNKVTVALRLA